MLSMTPDYVRSSGDPAPYLRRIADAGFSHVHWCHQWNTDFLYAACEVERGATAGHRARVAALEALLVAVVGEVQRDANGDHDDDAYRPGDDRLGGAVREVHSHRIRRQGGGASLPCARCYVS